MVKIKFTISYDGTSYFGWQRQSTKKSVQGTIENVLLKIFGEPIKITGAGRTDRGVHAKAQVASCFLPKKTDLKKLLKSLNALLPNDIRITDLLEVREDFHPRYSAKGKVYKYYVETSSLLNPFDRHFSHHHPYKIELSQIEKAIPLFIGKKDFSSFANLPGKNTEPPSPIKHIYKIDLKETKGGFTLTFHGDGFLYKMVRNITGALLDAGGGRISFAKLKSILEKKENTHGLFQAPALGLFLEKVEYDL